MRPLSAIDAIGPAWNHTSRLLLAPRNWRLLLKICAVAFFAQVAGCNGSFRSTGHNMHGLPPVFAAGSIALALGIGLIAVCIGLAFFYLSSRLQFVLFEVVLRSDTTVLPIWRRYSRATWHWIALKIVAILATIICAAPILIPLIFHFIHRIRPLFQGGSLQDPAAFFMQMVGFIGAVFVILLVASIGYVLLYDFGLPSMALESTPMPETVRRVWGLLRHEPGPVLLYLLMRFLLGIAASIAAYLALFIGALVAAIPLGGTGLIAWLWLRHDGLEAHIAMISVWVVLALAFAALLLTALIIVMGYVYTFLQAYALYFLGGRYPLVGQYLAPVVPPHIYPGVVPTSPEQPPLEDIPPLPIGG